MDAIVLAMIVVDAVIAATSYAVGYRAGYDRRSLDLAEAIMRKIYIQKLLRARRKGTKAIQLPVQSS